MSPWRLRSRLLDLTVTTVCVACLSAPFLSSSSAADDGSAVVESAGVIDQRVLAGGVISNPLNGTFDAGGSGKHGGSVSWDLWGTGTDGLKLIVSTNRSPAMRDAKNGIDVADYGSTPETWSVGANDRRFGMTVVGSLSLGRFGDGTKWRGFDGGRAIEAARRAAPTPRTRTTIKLQAEFGSALPAGARPTATIRATAVPNL
ncbi:MAG: hypothetical protein JWL76_793 [Thermoleophilia bacterium]|nr:hypothetical protein [Thermoleophilia bacterium]